MRPGTAQFRHQVGFVPLPAMDKSRSYDTRTAHRPVRDQTGSAPMHSGGKSEPAEPPWRLRGMPQETVQRLLLQHDPAGVARRTVEGLVGNLSRTEAGLSRYARQTMPAVDRPALGQYAKLAVDARSAKIDLLANLPTSQQLILSTGKLPKWHIGLFTHSQ